MDKGPMTWRDQLKGDPFPWLLEEKEPGPRYLALRDLLDMPADSPELLNAQKQAHTGMDRLPKFWNKMHPDGYWAKEPGRAIRPNTARTYGRC